MPFILLRNFYIPEDIKMFRAWDIESLFILEHKHFYLDMGVVPKTSWKHLPQTRKLLSSNLYNNCTQEYK